jgi:metal-responsive CopG/Arc/MetJ family transcriptional regulator
MIDEHGQSSDSIRVTLELDREVIEALEEVREKLGLRSRGYIINRLLREVLLDEEQLGDPVTVRYRTS